jgi:branched-chain amino acid transport system ATP-binding protein
MAEPLLSVCNLVAGYGSQNVLFGLDCSVERGELVAIVGPNGHGKTTLLRSISGLVRRRRGDILFGGQSLSGHRPDEIVAKGVVHVPQGDWLFPRMTVLENLMMGAHRRAAGRRAAERLDFVFSLLPKLAERRRQRASTLSGGERRMVGIGRGLMAQGELLMLDEPSLGLAPIVIEQIYDVIFRLKEGGQAILLVEENAARIADRADRMLLLDHGRFVWEGLGRELMARPEIFETYLGG